MNNKELPNLNSRKDRHGDWKDGERGKKRTDEEQIKAAREQRNFLAEESSHMSDVGVYAELAGMAHSSSYKQGEITKEEYDERMAQICENQDNLEKDIDFVNRQYERYRKFISKKSADILEK